jgi:hypothetical protein
MLSELLDGASRASGPVIVSALALAGGTYLMSQLIMHREAERAVPVCEAGYRARPPAPNLEELGRELTREILKQTLPKEYGGLTDLVGSVGAPRKAVDYASRCRCFADAALDDAGLKSRYWLWVGTLKLVGTKPDFHASMARAERLGSCGKEARGG